MDNPDSPSARIDAKRASPGDWRGAALARVRGLIHAVDAEVVEAAGFTALSKMRWRTTS